MIAPCKKSYDQLSTLKSRCHFAGKGLYSQSYGFSSSHVWMREFDPKKGRALKNWHFWTVVLEKTLESPLDSMEIKPVNMEGNQPWLFIGCWSSNTLATCLEEPTHWKRPRCWDRLRARGEGGGRGWDGWMASLTHWDVFEQTPGDGGGQRSLACYSLWGHEDAT